MTLLLVDSFDHYSSIANKYVSPSTGTTSAGAGRNGTRAGNNVQILYYLTTPYPDTLTMGFAWYPRALIFASDLGLIDFQQDLNYGARLMVTAANTFALYVGTNWVAESVNTYSLNTWYYLEFQAYISSTSGSMSLKVDGTEWVSFVGDTDSGDVGYISDTYITANVPSSYIDDLYLVNNSGTTNNDFLGDVTVRVYMPDADGFYSQWTPSSGSDHYALVNEIPPSSGDVTATSGSPRDSYFFQDSSGSRSILGIQSCNYVAGSGGAFKDLVRVSGVDYTSGSLASPALAKYVTNIFEQNPSTSTAWTNATVNGAEFGVELVT